jgi:hypothetical protein
MKDDYNKLLIITEKPEVDKAAIQLGLEELVNAGAIKKTTFNKNDYFILVRPFDSMTQNVTLAANTCLAIADIVRKAAEQLNRKDILINPLSLTENDIVTAISILMEAAGIKLENKDNN